jgi:hypothetical protein
MNPEWIRIDFNGMLGPGLVCVSHQDTVRNEGGQEISLEKGMVITVFDLDGDEHGNPDNLFATGVVEPSPDYARCRGSRWSLRINEDGIRNESEIRGRSTK